MFDNLNWIVVPGGPCMSAVYLKHGFAKAFTGYKLHYYEPLGVPGVKIDHVPTIDELVDQIFAVAAVKKIEHFGLITHSFGSYLAMRVLERISHGVGALIMINPMPFVFSQVQIAFQKILVNIPEPTLQKFHELASNVDNGPEIFNLLFPYYAAKPVKTLPRVPFNSQMCEQVLSQVSEYDDTLLLSSCQIPWVCIEGEHDPFYVTKDLIANRTVTIPGVGHYPFFEDSIAFVKATKSLEDILC